MSDDFNFSTGLPSDEMEEYIQMFVDETSEQLDELVEILLFLEREPKSTHHLTESFRLVHSIKGASAMMGLDSITLLTHHLENHFENLRSGITGLDKPLMNLILRCVDFLRSAVDTVREGRPLVSSPELIDQLSSFASEESVSPKPNVTSAISPESQSEKEDSAKPLSSTQDGHHVKRLTVYLDRSIELPELKAELILARLSELAVIDRICPDMDELSSLAELRTLQIWLKSPRRNDELIAAADIVGVDQIEIDELIVDEFVSDDVDPAAASSLPADHLPADLMPADLTTADLMTADLMTADLMTEQAVINEVLSPAADSVAAALARPALPSTETTAVEDRLESVPDAREAPTRTVETLRVDIQRLDRLMNLAGELVVTRARFVQLASQLESTFKKSGLLSQLRDLSDLLHEPPFTGPPPEDLQGDSKPAGDSHERGANDKYFKVQSVLASIEEHLQTLDQGRRSFRQVKEAIDHFSQISDSLQRGVLDTRMVPIGPLFSRFKRTVRDISTELGKAVHFVIRGEKTELDKRMIDELGDPLIHLVRNAIDHGLESASVRRSKSKPETGTLMLEAAHSGNHVQITISDDGGGINTDKVKQRAIERGLITPLEAESMSKHEIDQFIWSPGFSTADRVSDISGRGVGMDIVKTRINELNGTIEVDSNPDRGTKFIIRLPLTLAIIRSLLFQLQHGTFAAPIENVREIVSVRNQDIVTVHGRDSIEIRGDFLPLVRIEDIFDWHETHYSYGADANQESAPSGDSKSVLILTSGAKSMGLVVAELKGSQHIVVKSLDENFVPIRGLAGASILGDGSVCLLLDVASCIELARQRLRDKSFRRSAADT